jgi:phospholipid-translocating ATPase
MKDIHTFIGTFTLNRPAPNTTGEMSLLPPKIEPLTVENVLWANTVLAAGSAVGFVIYTGEETRAVMNTSHPETKVGLLDLEINRLAKVSLTRPFLLAGVVGAELTMPQILCAVTFALSVVLVALNGFRGLWYIYVFRFLILFSSIIPIRSVSFCLSTNVNSRHI